MWGRGIWGKGVEVGEGERERVLQRRIYRNINHTLCKTGLLRCIYGMSFIFLY